MKWTRTQKNAVFAAYLGWTLDAFDFFLMVFVFGDVPKEFHSGKVTATIPLTLTLAARPVGNYLLGRVGDLYAPKPMLMWNILTFSILEALSGLSPNITTLLGVRFLFGI